MNRIGSELILNTTYNTCDTHNVVYYILCNKCQVVYIGETKYRLHIRISQHLATIKFQYDTAVAQHFDQTHNILRDFSCGVLKHNHQWSTEARKETESKLIKNRTVAGLQRPTHASGLIAAGITVVAAVAAAPLFWGDTFLDQKVFTVDLPVFGAVKSGSALVFDLGVTAIVVGLVIALLDGLSATDLNRKAQTS